VTDRATRWIPTRAPFSLDRDDGIWFITQDQRLVRSVDGHFDFATNMLPEKTSTRSPSMLAGPLGCDHAAHRVMDGKMFTDRTPADGDAPENICRSPAAATAGCGCLKKTGCEIFQRSLITESIRLTCPASLQDDRATAIAQGQRVARRQRHGLCIAKRISLFIQRPLEIFAAGFFKHPQPPSPLQAICKMFSGASPSAGVRSVNIFPSHDAMRRVVATQRSREASTASALTFFSGSMLVAKSKWPSPNARALVLRDEPDAVVAVEREGAAGRDPSRCAGQFTFHCCWRRN